MYKCEQKPKKLDENLEKNFNTKEQEDFRETFPTPPQVAMCSPPISVTGDDEDISYSLLPQFSRNSSPMFDSTEEVCTCTTLTAVLLLFPTLTTNLVKTREYSFSLVATNFMTFDFYHKNF